MTTAGPLADTKVIDLTRVLAGPYCTMMLADMGARVIKVESPDGGDDSRAFGPFVNGKSAYFMSLNRGKESIALDLKDDSDRIVFEKLLSGADVLVENYRPGTIAKLGYRWADLHERYPRLVYAAVSGFGHTGPYAGRPAYDMVVQAMGGLMSLTGHAGAPPTRVGTSIGDTAGMFAAYGILAALLQRGRTGTGTMVDVSMLDGQVAILENAIARYAATGEVPGPIGARHPSITPFDAFAAADGYLVIAAGNDTLFRALCSVLARSGLADDERFADNARRTRNHTVLKEEIETVTRTRSVADWLTALDAAGVPCGPINTVDKVLADPQVAARTMAVAADDPTAGNVIMAGNPVKLDAVDDPPTRRPAPDLDADRNRILAELEQEPAEH